MRKHTNKLNHTNDEHDKHKNQTKHKTSISKQATKASTKSTDH